MKKQFVIAMNGDKQRIVAGFSETHGIVQSAGEPRYRKMFASKKAAKEWADQYVNCGYGLASYTILSAV